MISREEQRRFDEIARQLQTSDPDFAARMAHAEPRRTGPLMVAVAVVMWLTVPAFAYAGGWLAVVVCATLLTVAAALVLTARLPQADR